VVLWVGTEPNVILCLILSLLVHAIAAAFNYSRAIRAFTFEIYKLVSTDAIGEVTFVLGVKVPHLPSFANALAIAKVGLSFIALGTCVFISAFLTGASAWSTRIVTLIKVESWIANFTKATLIVTLLAVLVIAGQAGAPELRILRSKSIARIAGIADILIPALGANYGL